MAEWIALDRLLLEARPQRSVGLCDGEVIDHAGFRQRVLAWRAAFAAAEGRDWALYFDDAVAFAAALFGAWHAGKRVFLAADNLPATLQALQPACSLVRSWRSSGAVFQPSASWTSHLVCTR